MTVPLMRAARAADERFSVRLQLEAGAIPAALREVAVDVQHRERGLGGVAGGEERQQAFRSWRSPRFLH